MGSQNDATDILHLFSGVATNLCSALKFPQRLSCGTCRLEDEGKCWLLFGYGFSLPNVVLNKEKKKSKDILFFLFP